MLAIVSIMNKTITILFSFVLFTSCITESRSLWPKLEQEDISYGNRIEIQLTKVRMDSVFTSQSVFSTVTDNKIYIFDKYLSKSKHFNTSYGPIE